MKLLQTLGFSIGLACAAASFSCQAADNCGMANGKKAVGEPIKIGAIVGKTGPEDFGSGAAAAEAYFKCVNENGGINGRPVEYLVMDDAWNPKAAAKAAASLVRESKVVAMVGNASVVDCGTNSKLYESAQVAVIAAIGVVRDCFFQKNYAPINQGPRLGSVAIAQYAVDTYKVKKIVCTSPDIPGFGKWICGGVEAWGKVNGVEVKVFLFNPDVPDPAKLVTQIGAAKPDAVVLGMAKGYAMPIFHAAEMLNLGKSIHWVGPTALYNTDVPKTLGGYWDRRVDAHLELQPMTESGRDMQNWRFLMHKYGVGWRDIQTKGVDKNQIDTFSQAGFLAAKFTTDALLGIKGAIDRAAVTEALRNIKAAKSDMLCAPWYFGTGKRHNANHAGRIATMSDGIWKAHPGACVPSNDPELADVLNHESGA